MSGYLSQHRFEPHRESDTYCGYPDPGFNGGCVREPDHPIHALNRPEVESLAAALVARQWRSRPDFPELDETTEHRRHHHSSDCALCTRDVHAIAAFVIDYLNGDRP